MTHVDCSATAEPHPRVSTEHEHEWDSEFMCTVCDHNAVWAFEAEREETARLRAEKDSAYAERNKVVLALARFYPHGWGIDPDEPDWRVLYLDLPTGQASWHFTVEEFEASRKYLRPHSHNVVWDGHTTEEKYERLVAADPAYLSLNALAGRTVGEAHDG